ncbi:MAG: hypothetical protein ACRENP_28550 [Longimicrobiales bacterium]
MAALDTMISIVQPWAQFYNDSSATQNGILFLHFGALLVAGGYAVAADRWVLRAGGMDESARSALLDQLTTLHRPVVIGLFLLIVTGSAMALADAEALLASPVFWLKMSCFGLLLLNGLTLLHAEKKLRRRSMGMRSTAAWRKLQWGARRSFALWMLTLLLGTLLGTVA